MSLIGSIVERAPAPANDNGTTSQTPFPVSADPKTGFPTATHRQVTPPCSITSFRHHMSQRQRKSAFRQNMEAARPHPREAVIPVVQSGSGNGGDASWRASMEAENARKVASMPPQEFEDELEKLRYKFGDLAELAKVLGRAKDLKAGTEIKRSTSPTVEEVSDEDAKISRQAALSDPSPPLAAILHNPPPHRVASPARPILSRRSSVSGAAPNMSRAGTPGVRFAEVTPRDVFTYPSAPPSPKRATLLIEAPPAEGSGEDVPKVQWKGKAPEIAESAESELTKDTSAPAPVVEPPSMAQLEPIPKIEEEGAPMPALVPAASEPISEPTPEPISEPAPEPVPEPEPEPELKVQPTAHPLSQVMSTSSPSPPLRSSPPGLKLSTSLASLNSLNSLSAASFPSSPISLDLEPDTPEAIRLQYFPNEPEAKDVPGLQWMMDVDLPEIPDAPVSSEYAEFYSDSDNSPIQTNQDTETVEEEALQNDSEEGASGLADSLETIRPDPEKEGLQLDLNEQKIVQTNVDEKEAFRLYLDEQDAVRFNLAGTPIPHEKAKDLPTHDGLHHNSRTSAGYTLKELLHLARSTAPMQRAMALDALARLTMRVGRGERDVCVWFPRTRAHGNRTSADDSGKRTISGNSRKRTPPGVSGKKRSAPKGRVPASELRKLVIDSAGAALGERGAVGTRAVDCMYAALVVWDLGLARLEDVELSLRGADAGSNLHVLPSDYVVPVRKEAGSDEMDVADDLPLDGILGNVTKQLKARWLPRSGLRRLLEIVVRLARQSRAHASAVMEAPELVPEIMRTFILSGSPYPDASADQTNQPDVLAIRLLIVLARSSRQTASSLLDLTDTLLRFVAVLPPTDVAPNLLVATLDLYAVFGRYGMYAHIATTAASSFEALAQYVRTRRDSRLMRSWMRLRAVWTTCATDPHHTTPAHEILWSQVKGWSWGADALALCQEPNIEAEVLPDVWNAVAVWLEGASVNGIRAGETERAEAIEGLKEGFASGKARNIVHNAVSRLKGLFGGETFEVQAMDGVTTDGELLCAALRLNLALLPPSAGDMGVGSGSPLDLPLDEIASLSRTIALHRIWEMVYTNQVISPYAYTRLANLALFLGYFSILARRIGLLDRIDWLKLAFITLQRLPPSCAEIAAQIIHETGVTAVGVPDLAHVSEHLQSSSWIALLPFLLHDLQPEADVIISLAFPSPTALTHGATQLLPSRPNLGTKLYGLPVASDWALQPLNHLLRSGTSPVFQSLPEGWDSDEVDVVRTVLALTSARQFVLSDMPNLRLSGAEIVFGCMRVFMLEHGQLHDDSSAEIFRDGQVEEIMRSLLSQVSLSLTKDSNQVESAPLEAAASRHLPGQPLYQFYTDLVGLYDAVSFAHPIFSRILLPPLSMNYAIDYRRLLWGDYGHILRSIQTELADVPSGSLKEWLWPRDTDGEMIGWYLKALMKGGVTGFLRFIAVHHLATSLWPDLNGVGEVDSPPSLAPDQKDMERTRMIIGAIVHQAGPALFSVVVLYDQGRDMITPYPECWEGRGLDGDRRRKRLAWAVSLCGERVRGRLEHVLNG
ncbi:hypothetical protein FRC09_020119 [Ceratobasidium sp. 395]|nr:hypothetical protein FRC09_020119 [Ceratobasidium sp. 395]